MPRGKAKNPRTKAANGRVRVTKVHPEVWTTAMRLAKGDRKRISVQSADEVIVGNGVVHRK